MNSEVKKTGVAYCRVSSQEQVSGTSLAMQERYCREYAERENIELLGCYIEEGESAKTANRTEFQKALGFCANKKNHVDYFIVYKIDRFARNQDDHAVTQTFLKRFNTKLRSVTEHIDETPVGRAMEGMLAVFAEFDNNVRSSRSKSGMLERVRQGSWVWQAPIGYRRITKGGNLVIDDEVAPYIKLIFEEYSKNTYSFRELSDTLGKRGFRTRTGKKPCMQLMEKIIRNPIYFGLIRAFGEENKGVFEPIIDEELFWKCQPGIRSNFGPSTRLKENSSFPLRNFVMCPECGKSLTGSASTGRKGVKYPYYHHHKQECSKAGFIPKETFEQNFVEYLQEVSPKTKFEKIFKAVVIDVWQSNYKKLDSENDRIRKEIAGLESERQRVFDMHRSGKYTDDEFSEQKDLINLKIQQKKLLLDEKRIEEFNMEEALDYCFSFVNESARTWKELENYPAYRVRFQKQIFPEKITFDSKKFGTTKMSLVYEINQQSGANTSNVVRQVGQNWNQLINELQEWQHLGQAIQKAKEYA